MSKEKVASFEKAIMMTEKNFFLNLKTNIVILNKTILTFFV